MSDVIPMFQVLTEDVIVTTPLAELADAYRELKAHYTALYLEYAIAAREAGVVKTAINTMLKQPQRLDGELPTTSVPAPFASKQEFDDYMDAVMPPRGDTGHPAGEG